MPEITDHAICDRFLEALSSNTKRGDQIRFYVKYGIPRTCMLRLIHQTGRNLLPKPSWIAALVIEFGVSVK
jgi:hypothetical protein